MNDESPDSIISEIEEPGDLLDDAGDAPMIKLVNLMLSQAIKDRQVIFISNLTRIRSRCATG